MKITAETAALAMVGMEGTYQIMAGMLPSPASMTDPKWTDTRKIKQLKRNGAQGAVLSLGTLAAVSYFVYQEDSTAGTVLFLTGFIGWLLFMYEFRRALRIAEELNGNSGNQPIQTSPRKF